MSSFSTKAMGICHGNTRQTPAFRQSALANLGGRAWFLTQLFVLLWRQLLLRTLSLRSLLGGPSPTPNGLQLDPRCGAPTRRPGAAVSATLPHRNPYRKESV